MSPFSATMLLLNPSRPAPHSPSLCTGRKKEKKKKEERKRNEEQK
jgi:hypothetical protein